jgi:hypothetical protein
VWENRSATARSREKWEANLETGDNPGMRDGTLIVEVARDGQLPISIF